MKALRPVAVGLVLAVAVGGCAGRPDIRVDHRTISTAAKPLSDAGPPHGAYEEAWTTTVSSERGTLVYHLAGGHLIAVGEESIDAYDARTGKPSWHFREPGRQIDGIATTEGVVVAGFRASGSIVTEKHTFGLDAATGELLWENTKDWDLTYSGDGGSSYPQNQADAVDGVVPMSTDSDNERVGVDARTGDELWKLKSYDVASGECAPTKGERIDHPENQNVLPVAFLCESQDLSTGSLAELLLIVEPTSGEVLWSTRLDSGIDYGSADVEVAGGVTMIEPAAESSTPSVYGPDGRVLFRPKDGRCAVTCAVYASGGSAVLRYDEKVGSTDYGSDETEARVGSVELATGRTARMPDPDTASAPYVAAGGKLYGLSHSLGNDAGGLVSGQLWPAGLQVFDVPGQRLESAPMPSPTHLFVPQADSQVAAQLASPVAVGGGRLFTVQQLSDLAKPNGPYRAELTSYVSKRTDQPTELGGVSPDEWPDPCAMLAKIPRGWYEPGRKHPSPKLEFGDVTIERPACTQYSTTVRISWVAATVEEAKQLFPNADPSDVGADGEREVATSSRAYRVGRVIFFVETYDLADEIARKVISNLREQRPDLTG